jgi:hypothetical protein
MIEEVYEVCPMYKKNMITLRKTNMNDAEELLKCYSDEKAVPFFNSDNCHGDDFYYTTIERMKQAIEFWDFSYKNKYFVRWTVLFDNIIIGTVEMFHRVADDEFNHYGILRIDLQSKYENEIVLDDILEIANENYYKAFNVHAILTKAIPEATKRIASLFNNGFQPIDRKLMTYDDYYVCYDKCN